MSDSNFLRRAIRLAMEGRGGVEPNPMVGCVIVKDGRVIGEGIHSRYGKAHAEPTALADCEESPHGATAYVTLEPCCHFNKQTPPCVPSLIAAKIARVVVGCFDPNPEVDGKGIAMLKEAGIVVDRAEPEIEAECKQLIAAFIKLQRFNFPYVTLKWAESSNGKVAGTNGHRLKISNDLSMEIVHQLRARSEALAVGTNTVLRDDPVLTTRGATPGRTGIRVILSNSLSFPPTHRLIATARDTPVIVYTRERSLEESDEPIVKLQEAGVEVVTCAVSENGRLNFQDVLTNLVQRHVNHLLIETGPTLAKEWLSNGLADRIWIFRSRHPILEPDSPQAAHVDYPKTGSLHLDDDVLTEYLNPTSPVYFTTTPSADLVLTARFIKKTGTRIDTNLHE